MNLLITNLDWDFKNVCIPRFIRAFDECSVTSIADIVKFNKENSEKALPVRKLTTMHLRSPSQVLL